MSNFTIPTTALHSLDVVMQNTAHNIANINTDDFHAGRVVLQSGPYQDEGVRVGAIFRDMSPGPAVINHLSENDVRQATDVAASGMRRSLENFDTSIAQDLDRMSEANAWDAWRTDLYRNGQDARAELSGITNNNVDLAREFSTLVTSDFAYSANAAVIRAYDDFTGAVLSIKV